MLITLLAIMKTGAAYIPLDPEYPEDRILFILQDASAKMFITAKSLKENSTINQEVFL
jgi:non-ribosomal peptide synthetase component F